MLNNFKVICMISFMIIKLEKRQVKSRFKEFEYQKKFDMMIWVKFMCFEVNYVVDVVTRELMFESLRLVNYESVLICVNCVFTNCNQICMHSH